MGMFCHHMTSEIAFFIDIYIYLMELLVKNVLFSVKFRFVS